LRTIGQAARDHPPPLPTHTTGGALLRGRWQLHGRCAHLPHRGSASTSGQGCSCPASRLSDALLASPRSSSVERRNAQPVHTFSPKPPPPPAPSSNSEPALVIRLSSSDAATRRRHQTKNTGARGVTCRRVGPPRTPPSQRGMRKAADHGWHASTPFGHPPCPPCPQR